VAWKIRGHTGRLRAGSRPAATFGSWDARPLGDNRWEITTSGGLTESDPYWLEHGTSFTAVLEMGKNGGGIRVPAEIVHRDPLVFQIEIPGEQW
jgi:hypothetical protein